VSGQHQYGTPVGSSSSVVPVLGGHVSPGVETAPYRWVRPAFRRSDMLVQSPEAIINLYMGTDAGALSESEW
jgi:hypothetical protein